MTFRLFLVQCLASRVVFVGGACTTPLPDLIGCSSRDVVREVEVGWALCSAIRHITRQALLPRRKHVCLQHWCVVLQASCC